MFLRHNLRGGGSIRCICGFQRKKKRVGQRREKRIDEGLRRGFGGLEFGGNGGGGERLTVGNGLRGTL